MDYYQVLGVGRDADESQIKSAHRKLAMQHHPDRGGNIEDFQRIQEAYDVLGDPRKRAEYDSPSPNFNDQNYGFPPGFENIFGQGSPFGDIFGFSRRQQTNQSIQLSASISLEDAFTGRDLLASITLPSGRDQTVNIKIPQGIHEGTTMRLSGMGDDSISQLPSGDILLTIHIQNHPNFHRMGDDLIKEIEINCFDAVLGKTIIVTSIDGKQLSTEIPAGTQHDTVLNLPGYGMPNFNDASRRGRLLLKIKVVIPVLSEEHKETLRNLNINI